MSCPSCSHTLHHLGVLEGRSHYHCPRCGTHRIVCGHTADGQPIHHDTVPTLVDRCRDFADRKYLVAAGDWRPWHTLGIAAAIGRPEDRP